MEIPPAQALEADGVVEAAAHGLVHRRGGGVGNPDRREPHLVEEGVHHALLGGLPAAEVEAEEAEAAGAPAQQLVSLVDNHHAVGRVLLGVAHLDADHARLGLHVLPVFVALLHLERGAPELLREATREARLAGAGRPVEEDVALADLAREHLLENLSVALREFAVVVPRKDVGEVGLRVEAPLDGLVRRAVEVSAESAAAEVVVVVEEVELQYRAVGRERLDDFRVRAVERHRVVEGLLAVLDADRPREARLVADVREDEDFHLEVVQLKDALELCEPARHHVA